jgi:signal transduction histidine kinase
VLSPSTQIFVHLSQKGAPVLGKLSITQKLAVAVVAPMVVLGGVTAAGFSTFQKVKVNGPEYQKLATTGDLIADILPPPLFIVELQLEAQAMLRADQASFEPLEKRAEQLKDEYLARQKYWVANLDAIGDSKLNDPLLKDSAAAANEYFSILENEYEPALEAAYAQGWNPRDPDQFEVFEDADRAQMIFDTKLTPAFVKHRSAVDRTVALGITRRSGLEGEVKSTVSGRLTGLGLFALFGTLATFLFGSFIAQAVRKSLKTITEAANRAATVGLPQTVALIQSASEDSPLPELERVQVESNDELGELATALNSMQDTAVALASEQALVRRNVSQNLVNLARRNQALLGRSLNLLTRLEQDERDPDKLQDLFRVDHLTTRMRRNADSLLVLAGAEPNRKWSEAVDLGDVVRAAVSAIEAFDRVDIVGLDAAEIKGTNVNDIAHLVAELIENATNFSPPDSRVAVIGRAKADGYLLVITDDGLGMSPEDLYEANARISAYSAFESTPTRVLGLNVVGRLANRHGIEVSLAESATAGIAARIVLPGSVLEGFAPEIEQFPAMDYPSALQDGEYVGLDAGYSSDAVSQFPAWDSVAQDMPTFDAPSYGESFDHSSDTPSFDTSAYETPSEPSMQSPWLAIANQANHDGFVPLESTDVESNYVDPFNGFESQHAAEVVSDVVGYEAATDYPAAIEFPVPALDNFSTPEPSQLVEEVVAETKAPDNVRSLRRGLSKRIRGAQMVDTGPDEVESPEEPAEERPSSVMNSLANLQQGLARGRSEHPSNIDESFGVVEGVMTETEAPVEVEAPVVEAPVVEAWSDAPVADAQLIDAVDVEVPAVSEPVEEPKRKSLLGRRVRGAQLPDTGPITDRSQVNDSNPEDVRSALGSLQRGVASGVAAVENGVDSGLENVEV